MPGSSPLPLSSLLTYNKLEPPLAAEMWGLMEALATQLHINVKPAAPSSSSTAMEPSPAQGNRHKDKAPASPEDSDDDNEVISKSVLGGKSSSLAQGSGAPLYDIGLLNPRAELLSNLYQDIIRAVKKVSIGTHLPVSPLPLAPSMRPQTSTKPMIPSSFK